MAAWVGLARTSFSLYSRCFPDHCFASLGARWKKVHQQPPQTPLCFSTIRSKSGHVADPSSRTENRALSCPPFFVGDVRSLFESAPRVVVLVKVEIRQPSPLHPEPVAPTSAGRLAKLSYLNQIAYSIFESGYGRAGRFRRLHNEFDAELL